MPGLTVTKEQVNQAVGETAQMLRFALRRARDLREYVQVSGVAGLEALGFSPEDAALLDQAVKDMNDLRQVSTGNATVSPARDFTTSIRQLWGLPIQ